MTELNVEDEEESPTLSLGLTYLAASCCVGGAPAEVNMCGDAAYVPSDFCEDPATFQASQIGDYHCAGDELIEDEELCKTAGEEAWAPDEEEKCDVMMLDGDDAMKAEKCEMLGAVWEPRTCAYHATGFMMSDSSDAAENACLAYHIGANCCKHADGTPAEAVVTDVDACSAPTPTMCTTLSADKVATLTAHGHPPVPCESV
jgi:hypothetical protein